MGFSWVYVCYMCLGGPRERLCESPSSPCSRNFHPHVEGKPAQRNNSKRNVLLYICFKVAILSSVKQILMYSNVTERSKSNLPRVVSGYQIGILLAVASFTFFIFNPQEPISKFSGSLFDTDNSTRDQRNTRTALQEKHKSAMKGKTLPGTNTKAQPPVSAAGSFPGESSRFPEESRAVDASQPPLKVLNGCVGWAR